VIRWRHKSRALCLFEHRNSVIRDKDDKIVVVIGIGRDMTERIHMEEIFNKQRIICATLTGRVG
jgi:hypothetical protein